MSQYHRYKRGRQDTHYRYDDYRSRARSKIMGVCAGIANQFGWEVSSVRVIAVLGLVFMTGPTLLAYIVAGAIFY